MACPLSSCLATMTRKTYWPDCQEQYQGACRSCHILSWIATKLPNSHVCLAPGSQGGFWLNVRSLLQNGILGFREGVEQGTSTPTTGYMWPLAGPCPQRRDYSLPGSGGGATKLPSEHKMKEPETTGWGESLDTLGILSQSRGLEMGLHGSSFSKPWGHK